MKKWLVLFMSLGLALALAACGSTENASSDNNGDSKNEKAENKSSDKEVKMGQDIKVGDMIYNIKSRKAADQVGRLYCRRKQMTNTWSLKQRLKIPVMIKSLWMPLSSN